eukprot:2152741-Prymnesium_polylepis.1
MLSALVAGHRGRASRVAGGHNAGKPTGDCRGLKRAFCSLQRQMPVVKAARQVAVRPTRALPRPVPARRGAQTAGLADEPARG